MSSRVAALFVLVGVVASAPDAVLADQLERKQHGLKVQVRPVDEPPPRRIVFLNRYGGAYTAADHDDSRENLSTVPTYSLPIGTVRQMPAWNVSDDGWRSVMACSRIMWGRFNVEITDVDPGNVPHVEAVVGGTPSDIGYESSGGVSPVTCETPVIENSIVYVFPASLGNNVQIVCEALAQEVAHSYQLDHELLCEDPMTYLSGCGAKTFHDSPAQCGESTPRPCRCGGTSQNSVQLLLERLGPAETEAPVVTIQSPTEGAVLEPGFPIVATATDNYIVTKVDLWVDGVYVSNVNPSFEDVVAPPDLAVGPHTIELRAFDPGGNVGSASIGVSIEPECQSASDCVGDDQVCTNGLCFGDLGAKCDDAEDCASDSCALDANGDKFCSRTCSSGDACPSGFTCTRLGGSAVDRCYPGGDSGGCQVGYQGDDVPFGAGGIAVVLLLAFRPRRRRLS